MAFLFKTFCWCALLGVAAYGIFVKDFGGHTLAQHASEVWDSQLVRGKVDTITSGVRRELESRLAASKASGRATNGKDQAQDHISDADREALQDLIQRRTSAPPHGR